MFENQPIDVWRSSELLAAKVRLQVVLNCGDRFDLLDLEFSNLRASQQYLVGEPDSRSATLVIAYADALFPYLRQRGLDGELKRWCDDALRAAGQLNRNPAQLLLMRGEAHIGLGQWEAAMADIQAAVTASAGRDASVYARAMLALGRLQLNQGDYRPALANLQRAQDLLEEQSDLAGVAIVRSELAAYHLNRRELDRALALYLEEDELNKRAGAAESSDHTLLMLGVVHRKRREYEQAREYLDRLLVRAEQQGNRGAMATAAHHLAWSYFYHGHLEQAESLCGRALALYEEIGDLRGASDGHEQLGLIALAQGRAQAALEEIERSLDLRRQIGNQEGAAGSLRRLAVAHLHLGHPATALRCLVQSLALYRRLGVLSMPRLAAILGEFSSGGFRRRWVRR